MRSSSSERPSSSQSSGGGVVGAKDGRDSRHSIDVNESVGDGGGPGMNESSSSVSQRPRTVISDSIDGRDEVDESVGDGGGAGGGE